MQSVMKHDFSKVPNVEMQRSVFNRTHAHKTTFDAGYLIPIYCDEVLPGDTFKVDATYFARLATPIFPLMDNMFLDTQYFFVPNRLLWANWRKFCGEQVDPGDSIAYTVPQVNHAAAIASGSISDYLGLPIGVGTNISVCAFYHRAYNLIYNEWYRDQNLQDSLTVPTDDGPDADTLYTLKRRGKRHDYFTSALPWPQKGDAVELPMTGSAPVTGIGVVGASPRVNIVNVAETDATGLVTYDDAWLANTDAMYIEEKTPGGGYPNIYADLSGVTAATINELREAFQVQRLLERDARGGTRYNEIIQSHFGVSNPDILYRPEYLGGSSVPINIVQVPQTSETSVDSPQANLSAYGTATAQNGFTKSFTEHGVILGIMSVRADLTYQQGIPRPFSRLTRYDYYWPALAHLGEQEVLNKEIYFQDAAADANVFGYQERYAEYRYYPSKITGALRSTHATPLDAWHLSQEFTSLPVLDDTFIQETPPVDRVIAVDSEPHFILDSYIQNHTSRAMPTYSVPGLIDHF